MLSFSSRGGEETPPTSRITLELSTCAIQQPSQDWILATTTSVEHTVLAPFVQMCHNYLAGDGNVNGFGLEFFIETPGNEIAETIHDVKKSWQFQLLYTVSQLAAGGGTSHD